MKEENNQHTKKEYADGCNRYSMFVELKLDKLLFPPPHLAKQRTVWYCVYSQWEPNGLNLKGGDQ